MPFKCPNSTPSDINLCYRCMVSGFRLLGGCENSPQPIGYLYRHSFLQ